MLKRNIIVGVLFTPLLFTILLAAISAVYANGDFSLRLTINGDDISQIETVEIESDGEFIMELRISDTTSEVILHEVSVAITFAGQAVLTISEPLGNHRILPGEEYRREIPVNARELLHLGDTVLTTGIYRSQVRLEYTVNGQEGIWGRSTNIQVLGNPLVTPVGGAGLAVSAATLGALLWLSKGLSSLWKFALGRLESLARGRVVGSIVSAAGKHIVGEVCPVCGTRFKNNYCFTCGKSAKVIRREYRKKLKDLALQSEKLFADGEVTEDELSSKLNISEKEAADVLAVIRNARLFRVRKFSRGLMYRAIFAGIGFGISTIIWITVGGFAVLSTAALVAILIAAIVVPLAITWGLRLRAKRAIDSRALGSQ